MSTQYESYLFRLQRNEDQPDWRVTLINVHTGEELRFGNQKLFLNYLNLLLAESHQGPIKTPAEPKTAKDGGIESL